MAKVSRFFERAREFAVLPATIGSPIIGDRRLDSRLVGHRQGCIWTFTTAVLPLGASTSQLRFGLIRGRSNNDHPLLVTWARAKRNAVATI